MVSFGRAAILALLLVPITPVVAADKACDDRYVLHLAATAVDFDDRVVRDQTGTGLRLGLGRQNCAAIDGTSYWELELRWTGIDDVGPNNNGQSGAMLQRLRILDTVGWRPYWQAGLGAVGEVFQGERRYRPAVEAGLGALRALGNSGLLLRLDASVQGLFNMDLPDHDHVAHDVRVSLGLMLPLSAGS